MPATYNYLSKDDLAYYDGKIKNYIETEDAKALHTVDSSSDSTNTTIKFYDKENPTGSDTPDFSVQLPIPSIQTDVSNLSSLVGTIPSGATATNVVDYAEEYADGKVNALDGSATIASESNGVVTIKAGISQTDGAIAQASGSDIVLDKVATTGAAEDVDYDNTTSGLTATDVQAAIDEVAEASAGGVDSKTVYITETAGGAGDAYSKRYGVYQGATGSSASPVAGEKLADIDIPKDMVVENGSVVDIVFVSADSSLHEGSASGPDVTTAIKGSGTATAADAGKYIKLVIANSSSDALYIKATDLVDIYTAQQNATQIQLAIDSSNVISATVVAGSIGTTELAANAVTKAKLATAVQDSLDLADSALQSDDFDRIGTDYIDSLFD